MLAFPFRALPAAVLATGVAASYLSAAQAGVEERSFIVHAGDHPPSSRRAAGPA